MIRSLSDSLPIELITSYLKRNNWTCLKETERFSIYQCPKQDDFGQDITLYLPSTYDYIDSQRKIQDAISLLAALDNKSASHIINELTQANSENNHPNPDKLIALSTACDEITRCIFRHDRRNTLNEVVRIVYTLLEAESCTFFSVPDDSPNSLILQAQYSDRIKEENYQIEPLTLRITDTPGEGLTGFIAYQGEITELHGENLTKHPSVTGKPPTHLKSDTCYSLLGIPLKDRKKYLLGLMIIDNKKNNEGISNNHIFFTKEDMSIAKIISNIIVIVMENLRISETLRNLISEIHTLKNVDHDSILNSILQKSVRLLRANRGDLALWDNVQNDLILSCKYEYSKLEVGQKIPVNSVIRKVWDTKEAAKIDRVSEEPRYYDCDPRTKSELVVCLTDEKESIGVLNIESYNENFFDDLDTELLNHLGKYATIAYHAVGREIQNINIVRNLVENYTIREHLTNILKSVRELYKFDGGIIFRAKFSEHKICCEAYISGEKIEQDKPYTFSYKLDEKSFACEIFKTKEPLYISDPSTSDIVNQKGLDFFQIDSPLVGVPLIFRDEAVGVLVVWSNSLQDRPDESHKEVLEHFARIAATAIAFSNIDHQRTIFIENIQKIMRQMQMKSSVYELLPSVMKLVQLIGFERVRIFQFDEYKNGFIYLNSLGMKDPHSLKGTIITLNNSYAKDTHDTALNNPSARIYDPNNPRLFGPDPDAEKLDKPKDLPWAVVPLVIAGTLYGQLVADTAVRERLITKNMLDYLTLLGEMSAQIIANAHIERIRNALALPIITDSRLDGEATKSGIIKRLLVILTCGESLGYNRAIFLKMEENKQQLVYNAGLGSVSHDLFTSISQEADRKGLDELFDEAPSLRDNDLENAMEGFTIDTNDQTVQAFLQDANVQEFSPAERNYWPVWMEDFGRRIDANHILLAPVRVKNETYGVFLVDRRWDNRTILDADKSALAASANIAALILRHHTRNLP